MLENLHLQSLDCRKEAHLKCNLFPGIQEKLGIMNNGAVYAVFDYKADNSDELDMHIGDLFTVLKKGDEQEKEWWWVRKGTKEGYIPRNLLGVSEKI